MRPNELQQNVWYTDRLGKQFKVVMIYGATVRYENQRGNVGDTDSKKFASMCITTA